MWSTPPPSSSLSPPPSALSSPQSRARAAVQAVRALGWECSRASRSTASARRVAREWRNRAQTLEGELSRVLVLLRFTEQGARWGPRGEGLKSVMEEWGRRRAPRQSGSAADWDGLLAVELTACLRESCRPHQPQEQHGEAYDPQAHMDDVVKWCLAFGARPDATHDEGEKDNVSALYLCCALPGDDTMVLEALLNTDTISPRAVDFTYTAQRRTCLMEAASLGKTQRVLTLLRHGADFTLREADTGRTAMDLCRDSFPDTYTALTQGPDVCHAATLVWLGLVQDEKHAQASELQTLCLREARQGRFPITPLAQAWLLFSSALTQVKLGHFLAAEALTTEGLDVLGERDGGHSEAFMAMTSLRACARLGVLNVQGAMRDLDALQRWELDTPETSTARALLRELDRVQKNPIFVLCGNDPWPGGRRIQSWGEIRKQYHGEARRVHPDKQPPHAPDRAARAHVLFSLLGEAFASLPPGVDVHRPAPGPLAPFSVLLATALPNARTDTVVDLAASLLARAARAGVPEDWRVSTA